LGKIIRLIPAIRSYGKRINVIFKTRKISSSKGEAGYFLAKLRLKLATSIRFLQKVVDSHLIRPISGPQHLMKERLKSKVSLVGYMQTDARLFEILKKNPRRAIYSSFF
jgi:hypothetical protein